MTRNCHFPSLECVEFDERAVPPANPEQPIATIQPAGASDAKPFAGGVAAASVSIPHALGLGLLAFSPLADPIHTSAWALWSAAIPGVWMTMVARSPGAIYAPSTAVALLFGGMLALVMQAGQSQQISAQQGLAITGAFVCLGFLLQWLIGRARLAGLSRFLPVSVTQGFSAGVGLSLVVSQLQGALGAGTWALSTTVGWHMAIAAGVAIINVTLQRFSPKLPTLLISVALGTLIAWCSAPTDTLLMAAQAHPMSLPPLPDWVGAPWWVVLKNAGIPLLSLALLLGVVNGLEVLVFHQHLETEYGIQRDPNDILTKESLGSAVCALFGMIPASTSSSRSRTGLIYSGVPDQRVGYWHCALMTAVALSGHLWLQFVPMAVLAGALMVAGLRMLPSPMLHRPRQPAQSMAFWQSWLVATLFAVSGGVMALVTGLAISTVALLRTSAMHAIRRTHLDGKLRSRHVRRAEADAWLQDHMSQVAIYELQGIVSFGVAALVIEEIRSSLRDHRFVIVDASRVPSWDITGYSRLSALARQLEESQVTLIMAGVFGVHRKELRHLRCFDDLDRALDWTEERLLEDMPTPEAATPAHSNLLFELGQDLEQSAREALEACLSTRHYAAGEPIILQGELDRRLLIVQQGNVVLSTASSIDHGLRLAVIGEGMIFGEMAFLNGIARTAYGLAGEHNATVSALSWDDFNHWTAAYPSAALAFMKSLAQLGIRRLGMTSQELRTAME